MPFHNLLLFAVRHLFVRISVDVSLIISSPTEFVNALRLTLHMDFAAMLWLNYDCCLWAGLQRYVTAHKRADEADLIGKLAHGGHPALRIQRACCLSQESPR